MKSFVALSALVLAVCVVSSQGKSFGNKNVNKNVNDNSNSDFDFDFLSSFLDSLLSQQERKGKAAKAAKAAKAVPSVPIASKSAVTTSTAITDESPAVIAVAISRSLPDTTTAAAQQQQEDQVQSFQVEIGLADDEFVDDISAFDDSEQEESPFSAAQLKFFQSLMEA